MKRIEWIDVSKGIAILLVIAGHTIGTALIRGPIFSFHMPLFFVLSAYTMKYSSSADEFRKRNIPFVLKTLGLAYGLFLLHRSIQFVVEYSSGILFMDYLKTTVWGVFWSSGTAGTAFGNEYIKIGMMWFLVVFALARCIYDFIHLTCKSMIIGGGGIVLLITLVGISIIRVTFLPLSFDVVLTAIPFYYFGFVLKGKRFLSADIANSFKPELIRFVMTGIVWLILFAFIYYFTGTYFQYAPRIYPMGLMSFLCAGTGCITVFCFSRIIESVGLISNIFNWLGRHSLAILCVHYFDDFWEFLWRIGNGLTATILRSLIDLLIVSLILGITKKAKQLMRKNTKILRYEREKGL